MKDKMNEKSKYNLLLLTFSYNFDFLVALIQYTFSRPISLTSVLILFYYIYTYISQFLSSLQFSTKIFCLFLVIKFNFLIMFNKKCNGTFCRFLLGLRIWRYKFKMSLKNAVLPNLVLLNICAVQDKQFLKTCGFYFMYCFFLGGGVFLRRHISIL